MRDFDFAATVCGYDVSTVTGASDARHDPKVWDLLDAIDLVLAGSIAHLLEVRRYDLSSRP